MRVDIKENIHIGKTPKDPNMFTYFIFLKRRCIKMYIWKLHILHDFDNVSEMPVSGTPVVQSLPLMLFLLSNCCLCTALYTFETKGPCVPFCHITINLYDKFLTGDSCGHFWPLVVVSLGGFAEYIAPQNVHFIQPHSHNFMYLQALPDGCLNILVRNFSWPCGCWPQSWPAPKPLKKSTRFRDVKQSHAHSQTFLSQTVLFVSLSSHLLSFIWSIFFALISLKVKNSACQVWVQEHKVSLCLR